jgi:hypothetical protein
MYCGKDERTGQDVAGSKKTEHTGARCSNVEQQFPVNAICFVKCIFTLRINYESTETTLYVIIRYPSYYAPKAAAMDGI